VVDFCHDLIVEKMKEDLEEAMTSRGSTITDAMTSLGLDSEAGKEMRT